MRVAVELEPKNVGSAGILAEWQGAWRPEAAGGGMELAAETALAALLDLRARCFGQGITLTAVFPDNQ
jgi:hypothetical protein